MSPDSLSAPGRGLTTPAKSKSAMQRQSQNKSKQKRGLTAPAKSMTKRKLKSKSKKTKKWINSPRKVSNAKTKLK